MTGYSETSDKGHFERGQSSQQKDKPKVYSLYRKSPLKEDNLSTEDKVAGPEGVLFKSVPLYIKAIYDEKWKTGKSTFKSTLVQAGYASRAYKVSQ